MNHLPELGSTVVLTSSVHNHRALSVAFPKRRRRILEILIKQVGVRGQGQSFLKARYSMGTLWPRAATHTWTKTSVSLRRSPLLESRQNSRGEAAPGPGSQPPAAPRAGVSSGSEPRWPRRDEKLQGQDRAFGRCQVSGMPRPWPRPRRRMQSEFPRGDSEQIPQ